MKAALLLLTLLPLNAAAQDCAALRAEARRSFETQFRLDAHRAVTRRVAAALRGEEREELAGLAARFRSVQDIAQRIELQKQASRLAFVAARRAGYRPRNAGKATPYDADLYDAISPDRLTEYLVEARALLIQDDPTPHVTLWITHSNPRSNPRVIVNVGIKADAKDDYLRYGTISQGRQVLVSEFLESSLPESCRK